MNPIFPEVRTLPQEKARQSSRQARIQARGGSKKTRRYVPARVVQKLEVEVGLSGPNGVGRVSGDHVVRRCVVREEFEAVANVDSYS